MPREDLQKSLTHESYLSSVWKAPAQKRMRLRRQVSQALHDETDAPRVGSRAPLTVQTPPSAFAEGAGGADGSAPRLSALEFDRLTRRARVLQLAANEAAFEQGSVPAAVYLLQVTPI